MRPSFVRAVIVGVIAALALESVSLDVQAGPLQGGCSEAYVTRAGDTLEAIATRLDVSAPELERANSGRFGPSGSIQAGQRLCVPDSNVKNPTSVTLEALYRFHFETSDKKIIASRSGHIGQRQALPLRTRRPFYSLRSPAALADALKGERPPLLLAYREDMTSDQYTLLAIGDSDMLSELLIEPTIPYSVAMPISNALTLPAIQKVDVTLRLDYGNVNAPFKIGRLAQLDPDDYRYVLDKLRQVAGDAMAIFPNVSTSTSPSRICQGTYVTRAGDTLRSIAEHGGISVAELIRLNIRTLGSRRQVTPGQLLCLPVRAEVVLQATYQQTQTMAMGAYPIRAALDLSSTAGYLTRQLSFPLQPIASVELITKPSQFLSALIETDAAGQPPTLVALGGDAGETGEVSYTLVEIGDHGIFTGLRLSELVLADGVVVSVTGEVSNSQVTLWLGARDGLQNPFFVGVMDTAPNVESLRSDYGLDDQPDLIRFALFPPASPRERGYRALIFFDENKNVVGPSGYGFSRLCRAWRRSSNWFYRWLARVIGC